MPTLVLGDRILKRREHTDATLQNMHDVFNVVFLNSGELACGENKEARRARWL